MAKAKSAKKLCGESGQLTAKGKPCTNPAKKGSDKCGAHSGATGRPTITPSTIYRGDVPYGKAVNGYISIGMSVPSTAKRVGLSPATVESWIERGEADMVAGKVTEFFEFVAEFTRARVTLEADALETLQRSIKSGKEKIGDASITLKVLERLRPSDWSPTHKLEHSGSVNLVEQHADQLVGPLLSVLTDLGVADDPRVPDLIEKYFTPLEKPVEV